MIAVTSCAIVSLFEGNPWARPLMWAAFATDAVGLAIFLREFWLYCGQFETESGE